MNMIPCNQSFYAVKTVPKKDGWAQSPPKSPGVVSYGGSSNPSTDDQQSRQIQVCSTIDADIVLRRVIEDRAAIIALKSRVAENEVELMKAKARQLNVTRILDHQDQEIARLTIKANRELAEYNEMSKQYILAFMYSFEKGDIDKLPHHPFAPSLEELEKAIDLRKAMLIEKVQADDRVKKLEYVSAQERVTMKVVKKNEEAFLRAIDIAKQQFSSACGTWLDRVKTLLSPMPHHAKRFEDMKNNMNVCAKGSQVQAPENSIKFIPLQNNNLLPPQYPSFNRKIFAQDLEMTQNKKIVSPQLPAKRPIANTSLEEMCAKMPIVHSTRKEQLAGNEKQKRYRQNQPQGQVNNKRQKTGCKPTAALSHGEESNPCIQSSGTDSKVIDLTSTPTEQCGNEGNEDISIAHVLASLYGDKTAEFAVSNI